MPELPDEPAPEPAFEPEAPAAAGPAPAPGEPAAPDELALPGPAAHGSAPHLEPARLPEPAAAPPAAPAPPVQAAAWDASSMRPERAQPGSLDEGVERSRRGFVHRLRGLLSVADPDEATWEEVEETLMAGDVGPALAMQVVERARQRRDGSSPEAAVRAELAALLVPRDLGWEPRAGSEGQPAVVLVVGVNGTGKTTTIGKLAHRYRSEGRRVLLAAGDTFRAAAIDQLRVWAERSGAQLVAHAPGADPAAVVFDSIDAAVARGLDLVIADTAGRLHTKSNLMDELAKIRRVVDRRLPGSEPEVLFVLDATTGQNGLAQAKVFHETTGLTGIVLTKLDSTAKGGIVFAIEDGLGVPVRFVGVGEQVGDLLPFDPAAFVEALFA
ncbi:MAG TPA: signal recognition particle-docking protein FtsY [Candidatus Limnocylindrales bacterium]